jgi:hypothetical protein
MAAINLEGRVRSLEQEVASLKKTISSKSTTRSGWRAAVEAFKGDADIIDMLRDAEKIRDESRPAVRKGRVAKAKQKK